MSLFHWLGADAEKIWADHQAKVEAEAEAMRRPVEEVPE